MNMEIKSAMNHYVSLTKRSAGRMLAALAVVLSVAAAAHTAHAATINYGDFMGTTVMYLGVKESSTTDPVPLYGAPMIVGDSLVFQPTDFGSSSSNGASDVTDGQLSMTLMSQGNAGIQSLHLEESGDLLLIGPPDAFAMAIQFTPLNIRVIEIDGQAVQGPMPTLHVSLDQFLNGNPTDGIFTLDDEGAGAYLWSADLTIDINALVLQAGLQGRATKVLLTLDNKLATASSVGTTADIHKKDFALILTPNRPVPEPGTLTLAGLGLLGLSWFALRKRRT